ncbi:extracellular serine-rich protein [Colletotrichum plurivorum]|uniref:Extracellular serine-rich protein n=1 Tax=Colletotrichum plurivorum TaxID=2175906 RepID=A0A8H6KAH7_9PEZI|nr:extracellular serine-rich protein [Colletotrichum plurivorum]
MRSLISLASAAAALLSAVQAAHFEVTVGKNNQLKFDPETLVANRGDTITYTFFSKNHSVTQSSFDSPCAPVPAGFFSAFTPSPSDTNPSTTTFTITLNDTKPIWVFCGQGNHCQQGMLHSINPPPSGNRFEAFREKAKSAGPSTSPPDGLPIGGKRIARVEVGAAGALTFSPNDLKEPVGTVVEFAFNPRNHSVTQSSFDKPCQPSQNGFSSGLIPTALSPSGVTFSILVADTKPIWFYCAQTTGMHCQKGMLGAVNAPSSGNTLAAFTDLASKAPPSTLPPQAPLGGILSVNGTVLRTSSSPVIDTSSASTDSVYMTSKAGGSPVANWNFGGNISDSAVERLQLSVVIDGVLLRILATGYENLRPGGSWAGTYPDTLVEVIGTMAAQSYIHRTSSSDPLSHFSRPVPSDCAYAAPLPSADAFLSVALAVLLLDIGLVADSAAALAASDPWLVPALVTSLGARARMAGVVDMMQNHVAAAAPREVAIPAELVYSYIMHHYVSSCPDKLAWDRPFAKLSVKGKDMDMAQRTVSVELEWEGKQDGDLFAAWLGPWGDVKFSPIVNKKAAVPDGLYGHVWVVVTSKKDIKGSEIPGATVAGPEMVWVTQP